ncbi:hypothetical protein ACP70R_000264 [Stipagrostis hirtigluma subsp. patula]
MEMHGLRHRKTGGSSQRSNADAANCQRSSAVGFSSQRRSTDGLNSQRTSAVGFNSQRRSSDGVNSQRSADGINSQRLGANSVNSERSGADGDNSPVVGADGLNSQTSYGSGDNSNDGVENSTAIDTTQAIEDPPRRGRKKRSRTQLRLPPRTGKVQLKPKGDMQFTYVNYNPKDYKYGSQLGVIIKRLYPGVVKIRDEEGRLVATRAALSWNDYTWKKNEHGVSYARLVKQEFWNLFTVSLQDRRKADRNLENYLVKRITNLMYQARLDGVKLYYDKRKEPCDDKRARTIQLTEAQYLTCKLDWISKDAWAYLSHYWTTDLYKKKRKAAQEARLKSEDVAQNRGGSRPWGETQQMLEYKFGPEKAGTINTYAVMKSGMKNVDSSGNSAPIPSQKAQKRLADYKMGANPDERSQELDGKVLYSIGGGMPHGRVPIGNGAVDKADVLAAAKSKNIQPNHTTAYRSVLEENEQLREVNEKLKETNEQLKETNEILIEENSVNRDLILRFYADFNKEPPADLLNRLANIDARRHQGIGSSHAGSQRDDMNSNDNDMDSDDGGDNSYEDMDGDDQYDDMNGADGCDDIDDEGCDVMDDEEHGGCEELDMAENEGVAAKRRRVNAN